MPTALKVLTLNCWNLSPPYDERMTLVRQAIEQLSPDLIALQEIIVRPDDLDQARDILDGLGYAWAFGPAFAWGEHGQHLLPDGLTYGFGNVAASRLPIVARDWIRLPGRRSGETRSATGIVVDTGEGELAFVSTHLNWRFDHGYVREAQVVTLADFAWHLASGRSFAPIVAGDFNAEPDSAEIRYLRGLQSLAGRSVCFEDAWAVGGDGGPGWTWDNRNPFARTVDEPDRRIDYVFAGFDHDRRRLTVEDCRIVMNEGRNGVFPSDHLGLMAWVAL